MRQNIRFTFLVFLAAILALLNIRGIGAPAHPDHPLFTEPPAENVSVVAAPKVDGTPFDFIGKIEAISGNLWMVSGRIIAVSPQAVGDVPFQVGETVHMTGTVSKTGVIAVARVESPNLPPSLMIAPSVQWNELAPSPLSDDNDSIHEDGIQKRR